MWQADACTAEDGGGGGGGAGGGGGGGFSSDVLQSLSSAPRPASVASPGSDPTQSGGCRTERVSVCVDKTIQRPAVERRLPSSAVVSRVRRPSRTLGGRRRRRIPVVTCEDVRRPLLDPVHRLHPGLPLFQQAAALPSRTHTAK